MFTVRIYGETWAFPIKPNNTMLCDHLCFIETFRFFEERGVRGLLSGAQGTLGPLLAILGEPEDAVLLMPYAGASTTVEVHGPRLVMFGHLQHCVL